MNTHRKRIVIGYDGTRQAQVALEWAAVEAQRDDRQLTVLHAVGAKGSFLMPWSSRSGYAGPGLSGDRFHSIARSGAREVQERTGMAGVEAMTVLTSPVAALVRATDTADLMVVGGGSHGELMGEVLGSVALSVCPQARCPVTVVRSRVSHPGPQGAVVVGVDHTSQTLGVVRWAADLAARTRAPLHIVCAYSDPTKQIWPEVSFLPLEAGGGPCFDTTGHRFASAVSLYAERLAREGHRELEITTTAQEGPPAEVLRRCAGDSAAMVVVGSRGRGRIAGLLLGSVGSDLVGTSPCPVTVVPASAFAATIDRDDPEVEHRGAARITVERRGSASQ